MSHASSLGGSADVIFISKQPVWSLGDIDLETGISLYLQGVGDPGNVGTLVRSCVGFGAAGMAVSPGSADPYGPKAMRAGMGAQFLLPIVVEVTQADIAARFRSIVAAGGRPTEVLVAEPHGGVDVRHVHREGGMMLVLGSEREGPGEEWKDRGSVTIPQVRFDSLNVAMAGTVLLYELAEPAGADARSVG